MIRRIGESAGAVWRSPNLINEHSTATPVQIKQSTKLDEALLSMAIGWLARERKLLFSGEGKELTLSLRPD